MLQLPKGTIEHVPVNIADRLGNLTDLSTAAPFFMVRKESDESSVVAWTAADTIVGSMTAFCLLDTSTWDKDRYELLVKFSLLPEVPIVGPFDFEVV